LLSFSLIALLHVSLNKFLIRLYRNFSNVLTQRVFNTNFRDSMKFSIWFFYIFWRSILRLMSLLNLLMNWLFTWPRPLPLNFFRETDNFTFTVYSLSLNSYVNFPNAITNLILRYFLEHFEKFRFFFFIIMIIVL
jgi:hypothetical protein